MQGGCGTKQYGYDPRSQRVYRRKPTEPKSSRCGGTRSERIETFRIVRGQTQTQTANINFYFAGWLFSVVTHLSHYPLFSALCFFVTFWYRSVFIQ